MSGEGAIEHPMSTHSAPFGTSRKARGWRYIASILMILMLCVGNAWAINWVEYGCKPQTGGQYYLRSDDPTNSAGFFFNTPTNASSTNIYINGTSSSDAILFTVGTVTADGDNLSLTEISFQSGNTKYSLWPKISSSKGGAWLSRTTMVPYTATLAQESTYPNKAYKSAYYLYGGLNSLNNPPKDTVLMPLSRKVPSSNATYNYAQLSGSLSLSSAGKKVAWLFISPEAYEDATGTQYYYRVEAQVYTNGAASSTGGSMKMAPRTYKKPAVEDWTYPDDYVDAIDKKVKGGLGSFAVVNIYCQVTPAPGYNFTGFKDASNTALEANSAKGTYTYLPNTYEQIDAVNGIYRVSLRVNGEDTDHPTEYKLRACFAQAAEPVAYEYNANDEKIAEYTNLATAFSSAAAGSRIELRKDISNVSSAFTIAKNLTLDFNNHTITGTANNMIQITDGNVTFADNSTSGVGGLTTGGDVAVLVSGGSLTINDGKYKAASYAVKRTGGNVTIKNGGFESDATQDINGTITLNGGFFYNNGGLNVTSEYAVTPHIPTGMKYSAKDYRYMVVKKSSANYPLCTVISKKVGVDTLKINFNSLEGAIAYVNNNADDDRDKTILLRESCTLPAGNYTIPKYTILSVPYSADQEDAMPVLRRISTNVLPESAYCTLTLADGAHIDVFGAIEVGGTQTTGNIDAAGSNGISRPGGPTYGLMMMNSNSTITIYDDANFYAWGFVQGEGTIDVRRGGTIKEQFQIMDWKGFTPTALMAAGGSVDYTLHVLPVNQYFIQNVEVKATYRPGARLKAQVSAYVQGISVVFNDVGIIGVRYSDAEKAANPDLEDDVAIFLMDNEADQENTWVRKSYDIAHDVQLYEVNNSAYLGSLKMDVDVESSGIQWMGSSVKDINVDSRDFVLPLTNNFKIHLLNGTLVVTQNTALLPGSVIEIDKKATMTIMDQVWNQKYKYWYTSPQTLYLYDKDQWGTYVFDHKDDSYVMGYASPIRYRPGGVPDVRTLTPDGLGHGKLIVHGTVDVRGYLKTTIGDKTARPVVEIIGGNKTVTSIIETTHSPSTGGALIASTIEDAGTITLSRNAGNVTTGSHTSYIWQVDGISSGGEVAYFGNHAIPAWLTNETGSAYSGGDGYTETAGTTAGKSFCFIDFDGDGKGEWVSLVEEGCFVKDGDDYYAKPKDYVKLLHGDAEETDHTYKSADETRMFILMDGCQWWEVEPVAGHPDLFHCTHPQNDIYYYYDYESSQWKEKRYTVTWNNHDGSWFATYSLKYGTKPEFLGNVPQRVGNEYYTYDFIGWSPAITDQTIVTGDVTYTAQYERKDVMYTVTWKDLAGNIIESGYYKLGDAPTCTSEVDMTGKEWSPAVGAVTGNTIYQLQAKEEKAKYTITWKNWNGTTLQTTTPLAGTAAADVLAGYTEGTPSKPALDDIEFEFAGWTPTVVDANADAVYTATFDEQPITYAITWKNGEEILLVQNVTPNTVPQYTGATPESAEEGYGFIGWTPAVVAATEDQIYTAQFELQNKKVDGETYTIPASTQQSLTSITIKDDGKVEIPASSSLTVYDLILEATGSASGQLDAPANNNITTVNAYFDLILNTDARHWRAFGVPWTVNINTNPLVEVDGEGNVVRTLRISRDFEIVYFDGEERATNGPSPDCWKYLRRYEEPGQPVDELVPGHGYMIAFGSHVQTVRFAKKGGTPVLYNGNVGVTAHQICGISNPMTYHATISNMGATVGQVHDGGEIGHDDYVEVDITDKRYVVGKTVFIDPAETVTAVTINKADGGVSPIAAAPARRGKAASKKYLSLSDYYTIALTPENGGRVAKVYVLPEEDKAETYVAGHDLAKMGMSDRKAQIWVERYDAQLGLNTTALINDMAEFPLKLYAPNAGEYTLTNAYAPDEDYTVYLTRDGQAIWNLSDSPYALTLSTGKTENYGVRLVRKAPQIATGIDEAVVDAKGETRKVIINDKVFIIRGDQVYSVDGQIVK